MVKLELKPKQRNEVKAGAKSIMLTDDQAKSIRGRITAASRVLSCQCGLATCKTCSARERKRLQRTGAQTTPRKRTAAAV